MKIKKNHPIVSGFIMAFAASFLLCGYEFIRSASNALFKASYGSQGLPTIMAIVPFALILTLYVYGRMISFFGPRKTLFFTSLLSGISIFASYLMIVKGIKIGSAIAYVVREVYIILIIEQYWSFINSRFNNEQGKLYNGPITGISSLGAIVGGLLVGVLAQKLGTASMLLFAALSTLPAALLSELSFSTYPHDMKPAVYEEHKRGHLGLGEFKRNHMLIFLLGIILLTQVLSAVLSLKFQGILQVDIPDADTQTAYSGNFFALLNTLAMGLQFIGAPLLLKYFAPRTVHLFIPLIHIASCAFLFRSPSLATAGFAYMAFKVFDYSIFRAAKELLYIPLNFDARYRAKEVIDVFGYRTGKGGSSFLIMMFQRFGISFENWYSLVGIFASILWFVLAFPTIKLYEKYNKKHED